MKHTTTAPCTAIFAALLALLVGIALLAFAPQRAHAQGAGSPDASASASATATDASASAGTATPAETALAAGTATPADSATSAGTGATADPALAASPAAEPQPVPDASIQYRVQVNSSLQGWKTDGATAGKTSKKKLRSLTVELVTEGFEGESVQYQVHGYKAGWTAATEDGDTAEVASNDYIDGVKFALAGDISKFYDVCYRAYLTGDGWLDWSMNGQVAGTPGKKAPIRAIQVKLVRKASETDESMGIVGVHYSVNLQGLGWTAGNINNKTVGKAKKGMRVKNLKIGLDEGAYEGDIKYRVRLASGKWTGWKTDDTAVGSHNNIEAIQVKLTGDIAKTYDVVYRAYIDTVGWQRRMRNGETAGAIGKNLRIEAIRVQLVEKTKRAGWIEEDDEWSFYKKGIPVTAMWLDTAESPIDPVLSGMHRYWIDAEGKLATDRYVLPENEVDAAATYAAYASETGNLFVGKRMSSEGLTLSDIDGRLYTGTRWLRTSEFDGKKQRYRLVSAGAYSLVQTGLFYVGSKKYYGFEDGRGYVMRSTTRWVGDGWYKANKNGVLKNANKQTKKHIERYVKWAIKIAKNNSHGYSQSNRWGPDYDCSSLVVSALSAAGFPDSGALWTGNMRKCLKSIGFKWHKNLKKLKRGDILLVHNGNRQHTEIYIGKNKLVGAHSSENGGIYGAEGDQTGNEISVVKYYNAPWQGFLRYKG